MKVLLIEKGKAVKDLQKRDKHFNIEALLTLTMNYISKDDGDGEQNR